MVPIDAQNAAKNFDTNWKLLSVIIAIGMPYGIAQFSRTTIATCSDVVFSTVVARVH